MIKSFGKPLSIFCMVTLMASLLASCSPESQPTANSGTIGEKAVVDSINKENAGTIVKVNDKSQAELKSVTLPETVKANTKTEMDITISGITGNPYDFQEVDIYGEFVTPSGKVLTVPAFFYKDYEMTFEETDYTAEYDLKGWYGNVKGVFDKGDEKNTARGVTRVTAEEKFSYITQKPVQLSGIDTRSTNVFFSVKRAPGSDAKGYNIGFYSQNTGRSAWKSIDEYITDQWVRVSIPFSSFTRDNDQDTVFSMTDLKFFGSADTTGSILVKDFGLERENFSFPTVIERFDIQEFSSYVATDKYNGKEVLKESRKEPGFKLRFNAPEQGEYKYRISFKENGTLTAKYTSSFTAGQNETKGIVKVEPTLKRGFVYESGDPFLAIGMNTGWYTNLDKGAHEYYDLFEKMNKARMNWGRVFFLDYQFALFNYKDGTDNYDSRQNEAYRLDKIVEDAEEKGIYLAMALLVHGQFYEEKNFDAWPSWNSNPFNKSAGGYLEKPWEFFTDSRAKADFKKLARYIVARWGYSENVFAWELWNEVNHLQGYKENADDAVNWHREMANYVKAIDAYKHMVTTSIGVPNRDDPVNSIEELDYNNIHAYVFDNYSSTLVDYQNYMWNKFNKPTMISEIGIGGDNGDECFTMDPNMIYIKQAIWSGSFSGTGGGFTWWWETINKLDAYGIYAPVWKYFDRVDPAYLTMPAIKASDYTYKGEIPNPLVNIIGYKAKDKIYAYMFDGAYNTYNTETIINTNSKVEFTGMENGTYSAELFDTVSGEFRKLPDIEAKDGILSVPVDSWRSEIALLIEKQ